MQSRIFKILDFIEICEKFINNLKYAENYFIDDLSISLSKQISIINISNYLKSVIAMCSNTQANLAICHTFLIKNGYTGTFRNKINLKLLLNFRNQLSHSSQDMIEFEKKYFTCNDLIDLVKFLIKCCNKFNLVAIDLNPLTIQNTLKQLESGKSISYENSLKYPTNTELNKKLIKYIKNITDDATWKILKGETDKDKVIYLINKEVPHYTSSTKDMKIF